MEKAHNALSELQPSALLSKSKSPTASSGGPFGNLSAGLGVANEVHPSKKAALAASAADDAISAGGQVLTPSQAQAQAAAAAQADQDSFYRLYNREIKVEQDQIPIILAELTDAAYNFLQREAFDKALVLLQKAEGVLEVVNLEHSVRDRYLLFATNNNMAMCLQKLGMLDECNTYLTQCIQQFKDEKFMCVEPDPNNNIAWLTQRNRRLKLECKMRLQQCAILSQTQNHQEALYRAKESVKLIHHLFTDLLELCRLFSDKVAYRDNLDTAQQHINDGLLGGSKDSNGLNGAAMSSEDKAEQEMREELIEMLLNSTPAKEYPKDFLNKSVSLVEKSALTLGPVVQELCKRMAGCEYNKKDDEGAISGKEQKETSKKDEIVFPQQAEEGENAPDMRNVLGFLNQGEWIGNLNIGNIMQIGPLQVEQDFLQQSRDETELQRQSFLEKLCILIVSYFCMSTEMRFLLLPRRKYLKPETKEERENEIEYWHAKALEIACTFLPSECPLVKHVLLSYQKWHDPSNQPIKEEQANEDKLVVLRAINGVENSKFQPIIKQVKRPGNLNMTARLPEQPTLKQQLLDNYEVKRKLAQQTLAEVPLAYLRDKISKKSDKDEEKLEKEEKEDEEEIKPQDVEIKVFEDASVQYSVQHRTQQSLDSSTKKTKKNTEQQQSPEDLVAQQIHNMSTPDSINKLDSSPIVKDNLQGVVNLQKMSVNNKELAFDDLLTKPLQEDSQNNYESVLGQIIENPQVDKRHLLQVFVSMMQQQQQTGSLQDDVGLELQKLQTKLMSDSNLDTRKLTKQVNFHQLGDSNQPDNLVDDSLFKGEHLGQSQQETLENVGKPERASSSEKGTSQQLDAEYAKLIEQLLKENDKTGNANQSDAVIDAIEKMDQAEAEMKESSLNVVKIRKSGRDKKRLEGTGRTCSGKSANRRRADSMMVSRHPNTSIISNLQGQNQLSSSTIAPNKKRPQSQPRQKQITGKQTNLSHLNHSQNQIPQAHKVREPNNRSNSGGRNSSTKSSHKEPLRGKRSKKSNHSRDQIDRLGISNNTSQTLAPGPAGISSKCKKREHLNNMTHDTENNNLPEHNTHHRATKDNFVRTTHGFSESSATTGGQQRKQHHHFSVQPDRSGRQDMKDSNTGLIKKNKVLPAKIVRRVDRRQKITNAAVERNKSRSSSRGKSVVFESNSRNASNSRSSKPQKPQKPATKKQKLSQWDQNRPNQHHSTTGENEPKLIDTKTQESSYEMNHVEGSNSAAEAEHTQTNLNFNSSGLQPENPLTGTAQFGMSGMDSELLTNSQKMLKTELQQKLLNNQKILMSLSQQSQNFMQNTQANQTQGTGKTTSLLKKTGSLKGGKSTQGSIALSGQIKSTPSASIKKQINATQSIQTQKENGADNSLEQSQQTEVNGKVRGYRGGKTMQFSASGSHLGHGAVREPGSQLISDSRALHRQSRPSHTLVTKTKPRSSSRRNNLKDQPISNVSPERFKKQVNSQIDRLRQKLNQITDTHLGQTPPKQRKSSQGSRKSNEKNMLEVKHCSKSRSPGSGSRSRSNTRSPLRDLPTKARLIPSKNDNQFNSASLLPKALLQIAKKFSADKGSFSQKNKSQLYMHTRHSVSSNQGVMPEDDGTGNNSSTTFDLVDISASGKLRPQSAAGFSQKYSNPQLKIMKTKGGIGKTSTDALATHHSLSMFDTGYPSQVAKKSKKLQSQTLKQKINPNNNSLKDQQVLHNTTNKSSRDTGTHQASQVNLAHGSNQMGTIGGGSSSQMGLAQMSLATHHSSSKVIPTNKKILPNKKVIKNSQNIDPNQQQLMQVMNQNQAIKMQNQNMRQQAGTHGVNGGANVINEQLVNNQLQQLQHNLQAFQQQ